MAGNSRSGRRPSTIDRRRRIDPNDVPTRPSDLSGVEAAYWASSIVPCEHLTQADTDLAVECCHLYGLYQDALILCQDDPSDSRLAGTMGKYFDRWQACVKLLMLDPVGRVRAAKDLARTEPQDQTPEQTYFGTVG